MLTVNTSTKGEQPVLPEEGSGRIENKNRKHTEEKAVYSDEKEGKGVIRELVEVQNNKKKRMKKYWGKEG